MDYDTIFSELLKDASDASSILMSAYKSMQGADDFTSSATPLIKSVASSLSDKVFQKYKEQIASYATKATALINKFEQYKTQHELNTDRPEDFSDDIVRVAYEADIDNLSTSAKVIAAINQKVSTSDTSSSKKESIKAMCLSCFELFKGINRIIAIYNGEHKNSEITPITIPTIISVQNKKEIS